MGEVEKELQMKLFSDTLKIFRIHITLADVAFANVSKLKYDRI